MLFHIVFRFSTLCLGFQKEFQIQKKKKLLSFTVYLICDVLQQNGEHVAQAYFGIGVKNNIAYL